MEVCRSNVDKGRSGRVVDVHRCALRSTFLTETSELRVEVGVAEVDETVKEVRRASCRAPGILHVLQSVKTLKKVELRRAGESFVEGGVVDLRGISAIQVSCW